MSVPYAAEPCWPRGQVQRQAIATAILVLSYHACPVDHILVSSYHRRRPSSSGGGWGPGRRLGGRAELGRGGRRGVGAGRGAGAGVATATGGVATSGRGAAWVSGRVRSWMPVNAPAQSPTLDGHRIAALESTSQEPFRCFIPHQASRSPINAHSAEPQSHTQASPSNRAPSNG